MNAPKESIAESPAETGSRTDWIPRLSFWGPVVFLVAYIGVIGGGFALQFVLGDYPCPLCMLQRLAMILACIGPLWIIQQSKAGVLTARGYASGYGMAQLAALFGLLISSRQIMLHILPDATGYGPAILGLHSYTWAAITFLVVILFGGLMLTFDRNTVPIAPSNQLSLVIVSVVQWAFVLLVVANIVMVIALAGPNWTLPDDPTSYLLFN